MRRLLVLLLLVTAACSEDEKQKLSVPTKNGVQCNPVSLGDCLLPIPSSYWEKQDPSTPSGFTLNLPAKLLPAKVAADGKTKIPLDPAPYNAADGWSPATSIFVHAKEALSADNLPPHEDIAASLKGDSPTILLDADTGERVAHWAELDKNDTPPARRGDAEPYADHGLLIRPAGDLLRGHRYIVAITRSLKTATGGELGVPAAFAALRDGKETDNAAVERQRQKYAEIFSTLSAAGVDKGDLLIAWDFHTASDEYIHRDILAMRAQAIEALGDEGIGYEITSIEQSTNADHSGLWKIEGTFESPLFLEDGGDPYQKIDKCKNEVFGDCSPAGYVRDADGLPLQAGTWSRPFILTIPAAGVAVGSPQLVQFGHGLLGGGGEIMSGYNRDFAKQFNIAFIAGDWTGLSSDDVPVVSAGLINWNLFATTAYRLGQGHIDAIALSYTARQIAKSEELKTALGVNHDVFDPSAMTYYGISLGGIMGGGFMALHPFIRYGVLNVAGSTWSTMIQRSSNWNTYGAGLATGYPSYLDAQTLLTLSQTLWDISDPIAFAPHLIKDPFPGTEAKKILYQEAVGDSQVPNVASEKMVRAAGLPLLTPSVREVYGVETVESAPSALTIWDEKVAAVPPRTNIPPPEDNGTHGSIRKLPALMQQISRFLWGDHKIVNTCSGVCDPE